MNYLPVTESPGLTSAEERLRSAFSRGDPLDLTHTRPHGDEDGRSDRGGRLIHGSFLRQLLLSSASPPEGRVRQLILSGADIHGPVDLRFAKIDFPVRLERCRFDAQVTLTEADLRSVSLCESTGQVVDADHVRVTGDLLFDHLRLTGCLRLAGAHLQDDLHLSGTTIEPATDVPGSCPLTGKGGEHTLLNLDSIDVKGRVVADGLRVRGTLSMDGATVAGSVRLTNAQLGPVPTGSGDHHGVAWWGDGLTVGGELDASGLVATGHVRLIDARVLCLVLKGAHVASAKAAVVMDRLDSHGSVFCNEGTKLVGGIKAIGIQVGATLYLHGEMEAPPAQDGHEDRIAVDLRRAKISGDLRCEPGLRALGTVAIGGAHIGGEVSLSGATLRSTTESDVAFNGAGAQVDGSLLCSDGFTCDGRMGLVNARIRGNLVVAGNATSPRGRTNHDGETALVAAGLTVGRGVRLQTGGTLNLSGSDITGDLSVDLDGLSAPDDQPAADLSAVTADVLALNGRQRNGYLDLTRASARLLLDNPANCSKRSRIVLAGLRYDDIAAIDSRDDKGSRITWLEAGTRWTRRAGETRLAAAGTRPRYDEVGFTSQPYQQLASVYQRAGQESDARDVMHAMFCRRNAVINRRQHRFVWLWNVVQNIFLGYGYRPMRAFAWVISLVAASSLWFIYIDRPRIGIVQAAALTLGLALPGSAFDKFEKWGELSTFGHLVASALVLVGLLLGATVLAAVGRFIKR